MPKPVKNHDWVSLKVEYLSTPGITLRDFAKLKGIEPTRVFFMSAKDGWQEAKEQVASRAIAKTVDKVAEAMATVNESLFAGWHNILAQTIPKVTANMNLNDLRTAAQVMHLCTQDMRLITGEATIRHGYDEHALDHLSHAELEIRVSQTIRRIDEIRNRLGSAAVQD